MSHARICQAAALATALTGMLQPLGAQERTAAAGAGVYFANDTFATPAATGAKAATVLSAPLALRLPVGAWLRFDVSGGMARGEVKAADGSSATLSSLTDTEVRG